jgi:hypothetical protein
MTGSMCNTYVIDVNTSRTPEEGAHSPSLPNELVIIVIIIRCDLVLSGRPETLYIPWN